MLGLSLGSETSMLFPLSDTCPVNEWNVLTSELGHKISQALFSLASLENL